MNPPQAAVDHLLLRIAQHAERAPDEVALRFVQDAAGQAQTLTWADVLRGAWAARELYASRGLVPGDRVMMLLPTGAAHTTAVLGAIWAGLAPTTLPNVSRAASADEIAQLVAGFTPKAIVSSNEWPDPSLIRFGSDDFGRIDGPLPETLDYSTLQDIAYVQFTSGSTGLPRGLALTWQAICANLLEITRTTGMAPGQRAVSWLPMYHDMGVFGSLFATLYGGCEHTLMDPSLFVANPLIWLRVMQEQRATLTVAPPSALKTCMELLARRPIADLRLSDLKQIVCGAEPIAPGLVATFAEVFEPYGLDANALRPAYGLAEATVAVCYTPLGRGARIDRVNRQRFETLGHALANLDEGEAALAWVSAGYPLPGIEVSIRDENDKELAERRVGRVWIRSPSLYHAVLEQGESRPRQGEWLDSGDVGYLAKGELYLTGRRKDIIIKNGRNYTPERLEYLAGLAHGVRHCAAFGVYDEEKSTERLIVMVEVRGRDIEDPAERDLLRMAVRRELRSDGCQVDDIVVVPRGTLPLTTSGKVRRQQCREIYLQGLSAGA